MTANHLNMPGGMTALAQADRQREAERIRRHAHSVIDTELILLVERSRRLAEEANALLADALALNTRVRRAMQEGGL